MVEGFDLFGEWICMRLEYIASGLDEPREKMQKIYPLTASIEAGFAA